MSATAAASRTAVANARQRLPAWLPLAVLVVLAAGLRLSTLGLQSFWYDEAFTPVHVLNASLGATLRAMVHTENTPPLWYLIEWVDARVLGTGEVALRLPSALAGIATVPVVWAIGEELGGRRAGLVAAALVAVNPLFVWYSQEARAYGLFVLTAALAMLCFLRAEREPTRARMGAFAFTGALALLTHYFALFLLIPMVLWMVRERITRRAALPAVGILGIVGLALLPLISAQGGHGTQWIGRWALSSRLEAIPQYYLTGYSGAPLGHAVELLVALPIVVGLAVALWRMLDGGPPTTARATPEGDAGSRASARGVSRPQRRTRAGVPRGSQIALLVAAGGILTPIALAILGADYLAPRNLVAAMVPVTGLIAVMLTSPQAGRLGIVLAATIAVAFLILSIDVNLSPRLQRGNWRAVARALRGQGSEQAITTVELGAAPLEYYLPGLRNLGRGTSVTVGEIDETGYAPLRASAGRSPAPGFRPLDRLDLDGLLVYRFVSPIARAVSEATLRRHVITLAHPEVLVPPHAHVTFTPSPG
jgi:mannosyltransferase